MHVHHDVQKEHFFTHSSAVEGSEPQNPIKKIGGRRYSLVRMTGSGLEVGQATERREATGGCWLDAGWMAWTLVPQYHEPSY